MSEEKKTQESVIEKSKQQIELDHVKLQLRSSDEFTENLQQAYFLLSQCVGFTLTTMDNCGQVDSASDAYNKMDTVGDSMLLFDIAEKRIKQMKDIILDRC